MALKTLRTSLRHLDPKTRWTLHDDAAGETGRPGRVDGAVAVGGDVKTIGEDEVELVVGETVHR